MFVSFVIVFIVVAVEINLVAGMVGANHFYELQQIRGRQLTLSKLLFYKSKSLCFLTSCSFTWIIHAF